MEQVEYRLYTTGGIGYTYSTAVHDIFKIESPQGQTNLICCFTDPPVVKIGEME